MRPIIPIVSAAAILALALTADAQDTTVKSQTRIKADDAHVVTMTGCLRQDLPSGHYLIRGTVAAAGESVKTQTKVTTDVDKEGTTVRTETKTDADRSVATSGVMSTFVVLPGDKVNLAPHVGRQVQLSAAMLKPGEDDADVKVEEKTTVDPEGGRATTSRNRTKIEVAGAAPGQYTVVSVKPLGGPCVN